MGTRKTRKSGQSGGPHARAARLPAAAFEAISVGACVIDRQMRLHLFNRQFIATFGLSGRHVHVGVPLREALDRAVRRGSLPLDVADKLHGAMQKGVARSKPFEAQIQLAEDRTVCVRHAQIGGGKWLVACEDVSVRRRLKNELELQVRCLNHALANMSQGLCLFGPDERLIMRNDQYCAIYDIDPDFVKPGILHREIVEHWVARGNQPDMSAQQLYEKRMREIRSELVKVGRLVRRDGRIIEAISRVTPEGGWVSTNEDITERCQAEARISHMARHDPLTDLPNRILFRESLADALMRVAEGSHTVSLLLVDLDEFKATNDRFGHAVGDALLEAVAKRLARSLRDGDVVARLGGDEFAMLVQTARPGAVARLACRLLTDVSRPAVLGGHRVTPGLSIGIARAPHDGATEAVLMQCADDALYRSKNAGRRTYRFFDRDIDLCMRARFDPDRGLRRLQARGAERQLDGAMSDLATVSIQHKLRPA